MSGAEPGSAAASVATQLGATILEQLSPGSSLPSEGELAARYGVSRLTVREAIKMLAGRGLLELSRGRRAVVRQPDGKAFGDFLTAHMHHDPKAIFDLNEVRLSLEVQAATLAAGRINRASLTAVEAAQDGMREAATAIAAGHDPGGSELKFHESDIRFHESLALASGNRVLSYLFEAMATPLREGFFISRRGHELRGHSVYDTIEAHQRILEAVAAGDARAAGDAMRLHLKDTERDIRAALSKLALPGQSMPV